MSKIQLKRNLSYEWSLQEAINSISRLELSPGEPLVCTYTDNGVVKMLLAIGDGTNVRIIPAFNSYEDLISHIENNMTGEIAEILKDAISTESDFNISSDAHGKLIFNMKDSLKNIWIDLNNE